MIPTTYRHLEPRQTFPEWMHEVNAMLLELCGMVSVDLPDAPYADWYQDRYSPMMAVKKALRNAKRY